MQKFSFGAVIMTPSSTDAIILGSMYSFSLAATVLSRNLVAENLKNLLPYAI